MFLLFFATSSQFSSLYSLFVPVQITLALFRKFPLSSYFFHSIPLSPNLHSSMGTSELEKLISSHVKCYLSQEKKKKN